MESIKKILYRLTERSRRTKQRLVLLTDIFLIAISLWLAFALRLGTPFPVDYLEKNWYLFILLPLATTSFFYTFGLYRSVLQYYDVQTFLIVVKAVTISTLTIGFGMLMAKHISLPRTVFINYWFITVTTIIGIRYIIKWVLYKYTNINLKVKSVAIYGAGIAGAMLVDNIKHSGKYKLLAIIDDDPEKQGTNIGSYRVYSPKEIGRLISKNNLELILVAIPSMGRFSRSKLLKELTKHPVNVMELPSIENIIDGKVTVDNVREVTVRDILGREAVKPIVKLLSRNVVGKNVMVTGAGGSIGSELCRQILKLGPKTMVLFENCEFNLYSIHEELTHLGLNIPIIPILASVLNSARLKNVLQDYSIQTLYHAAAYKHVPMVEMNPSAGVLNNIVGTYRCAVLAKACKVETFVLISTDKAVRPTNVMGATKRFTELILQGINGSNDNSTCFSMVRFGNVLDSAGSVVPKFRNQIKNGGPVTVTHEEIYRYFMSIPEAVQLVLQAGGMANGGDVFILDMGEPVNILKMAKSMIYLSGFTPIDSGHPKGDIVIEITGLRPGEKLFEELLIGDNVLPTEHPLIMKANEKKLDWSVVTTAIDEFTQACEGLDEEIIFQLLKKYIKEYIPTPIKE